MSWKEIHPALDLLDSYGHNEWYSFATKGLLHIISILPHQGNISPLYLRSLLRLLIKIAKDIYCSRKPESNDRAQETLSDIKTAAKKIKKLLEKDDFTNSFDKVRLRLIKEPLGLLSKLLEHNGNYYGSLSRYLIKIDCPIVNIQFLI